MKKVGKKIRERDASAKRFGACKGWQPWIFAEREDSRTISPENEGEKRMRERRSRTSLAPKQKI